MKKKNRRKIQNNNRDSLREYARYSGIAAQMMVIITAGVWGGVKLDDFIPISFPLLTVTLSLAAVSLAIYIAVKDFL